LTQPTKNWKISTQTNPIHGSTQPMDNSGIHCTRCGRVTDRHREHYTLSQKMSHRLSAITLSNLNWFSKFFHCQKLATNTFNTSHHTLIMLLHYLTNLSSNFLQMWSKKPTTCIAFYIHPFTVTRLLAYYLLTYYFSFWLLLNILWNGIPLYANSPKCISTLGMRHCTTSRPGNTFFIRPDLCLSNSPDITLVCWKIWGVI